MGIGKCFSWRNEGWLGGGVIGHGKLSCWDGGMESGLAEGVGVWKGRVYWLEIARQSVLWVWFFSLVTWLVLS